MRRPWPNWGCRTKNKQNYILKSLSLVGVEDNQEIGQNYEYWTSNEKGVYLHRF